MSDNAGRRDGVDEGGGGDGGLPHRTTVRRKGLAALRSRRVRGPLLVAVVVVLTRVYIYGSVFRSGDVVLLANDPYARLDRVIAVTGAAAGLGDLAGIVSDAQRYPLFIATLSAIAEVAGDDRTSVETLVAWYPVVAALATGGAVYAATQRLTGARWGGVAGGVAFAIAPVTVVRTALGFGDHHAFDYVWMALAMWAVVALADADEAAVRTRVTAAAAVAVAVAVQILAWRGGVLLVVPLGIYAQYCVFGAVRTGRSPVSEVGLLTLGLGVGTGLVFVGHRTMAWFPGRHVLLPVAMVCAVAGVALAGELARRTPSPTAALLGLEAVAALVAWTLLSGQLLALLREAVAYQARVGHWNIVEGLSLFGGGPFGWVTGPLSLFGLLAVFVLPGLALATWWALRSYRPAVAAVAGYAWYFLALAVVQRRFAAELVVSVAPLAAVGVIALAGRSQVLETGGSLTTREGPFRLNTDVSLVRVGLFTLVLVLVASASFVLIPLQLNQVTYSHAEYDATQEMRVAASERGWGLDDGFVFSRWDHTRMYNYHVYGEAPWYSYARRNYPAFLANTRPEDAYERHRDHVGFVVTTDEYRPPVGVVDGSTARPVSLYTRLHDYDTSRVGNVAGLAHFRLFWTSPDGAVKVFTLVPGATIVGTTDPNATVSVSTTLSLDHTSVRYTRVATSNSTGWFGITVPYPGEYAVGTDTVTVPESAVSDNGTVHLDSTP